MNHSINAHFFLKFFILITIFSIIFQKLIEALNCHEW